MQWKSNVGGRLRWVPMAAAAASAVLGIGVGAGAMAGRDRFAGLPGAALPGAVVLLVGAAMAVATRHRWGQVLPRRLVAGSLWTVAALCLAGSCWLLLDLCQLALEGTVTDRTGHSAWLTFGERLALTLAGALFVATALAWRRTGTCVHCGRVHVILTTDVRPAEPRPASRRIRWIAYAGCLAWLPYAGLHTLGALGVRGIEPGGDHPRMDQAVALWAAIGLAVFLLLGLVSPWGQVFPRWAPPLTGRRVPRWLPIAPVWLIAPTLALYGLGSCVFVLLLDFGVVTWRGGADPGLIGLVGQPISFAGYGLALAVTAVSYQARTRPIPGVAAPCPVALPLPR
jgi:hypothetical protein